MNQTCHDPLLVLKCFVCIYNMHAFYCILDMMAVCSLVEKEL